MGTGKVLLLASTSRFVGNPPVVPGITTSSGIGRNAFGNSVRDPSFGRSSSFDAPYPLGPGAASTQALGPPSVRQRRSSAHPCYLCGWMDRGSHKRMGNDFMILMEMSLLEVFVYDFLPFVLF